MSYILCYNAGTQNGCLHFYFYNSGASCRTGLRRFIYQKSKAHCRMTVALCASRNNYRR